MGYDDKQHACGYVITKGDDAPKDCPRCGLPITTSTTLSAETSADHPGDK